MKRKELINVLDECLESILIRGETIEQCLASHPEQSAELEPLLRTVVLAKEAADISPRPSFRERTRHQFQAEIRDMKLKEERHSFGWQPRWATVMVTVVLALLVGGSGTVAAAQSSMPDELLYQVKLTSEAVRISLTPSDVGKAELYVQYTDRRVAEIAEMATEGKQEQVEEAAELLNSGLVAVANLVAPPAEDTSGLMAPAASESQEASSLMRVPQPTVAPTPVPTPATGPSLAARQDEPETVKAPNTITLEGQAEEKKHDKTDRWDELQETLARGAANNTQVLIDLLDKAPESAKPALLKAIEKADEGYQQALEALEKIKDR